MTRLSSPAPTGAPPAGLRPRVALINQPWDFSIPPRQTSLAIWAHQVGRRLAETCDVVIYGRRPPEAPLSEERDGIAFRHIGDRRDSRIAAWLARYGGYRRLQAPLVSSRWYGWEYARRVARDLAERRVDLALLFNFTQYAPVLKRACPRMHLVLAMHCEWASQFDEAMIRRRLAKVDTVVGCSAYIARKIAARFPDFPGECRALYDGVDVAQFAGRTVEPDAAPRVLFVGRISPEKGLHVLLDAFARVVARFPEARLDIVGAHAECPREILVDLGDEPMVRDLARFYDGRGYAAHLNEQIRRHGLASRVEFSGFLPHAEAVRHFHRAWVLVNPSLSESFGMSLAEGMAAGIPVVATRVGGMVEVVDDGVTGSIVAPDDPTALAEALIGLLSDGELRRRMGEAGRRRASACFSWQRAADDVAALAARAAGARS